MPNRQLRRFTGELNRRRMEGERRAGGIERDVDTFRRDFDATEAARTTAGAMFEEFAEDHARGIRDLRGQQVGMGRLRTGFATEDEDMLTQDLNRRISREIARGAFTAASLDLQNVGAFSGEGIEARRAADGALTSQLDRAQAAENQRQQRRRSLLGLLGGGAGALIGGKLGGPAGAAVGARIGGSLGGV